MLRIWFKKRYVVEVLGGLKRETTRRYSRRMANLKVDQQVGFSVGNAKPFAIATITEVTRLSWDELDDVKQAELAHLGIADDDGHGFVRIAFDNVRGCAGRQVCGAADGRCTDPDRCEAASRRQERGS